MKKVVIVCFVIFLCSKNIKAQESNAVKKLEPAEAKSATDLPYLVGFMKSDYGRHTFCGGTLITPKKIVTAAHCFYIAKLSDCYKGTIAKSELKNIYAVIGNGMELTYEDATDGSKWDEKLEIREMEGGRYPVSYEYPDNDIAVLYPTRAFETGGAATEEVRVKPLAFAVSKHMNAKQAKCVVTCYMPASGGGGRSGAEPTPTPGTPAKTGRRQEEAPPKHGVAKVEEVEVMTIESCNILHNKDMSKFICLESAIDPKFLQRNTGGTMMCKETGDANDINGVFVGVILVNNKTGKTRDRHFFTRVSEYSDFIGHAPHIQSAIHLLLLTMLFLYCIQ